MSDTVDTRAKGNTNYNLRSRNWFFTLNNWTEEEKKDITEYIENSCTYGIFQPEIGENGTPHLQGCMEFKNPVMFKTLKNKFPRMHLEKTIKRDMAIKYCGKDETKAGQTFEFGETTAFRQNLRTETVEKVLENLDMEFAKFLLSQEYKNGAIKRGYRCIDEYLHTEKE